MGALAVTLLLSAARLGWVAGRVANGAFVDAENAREEVDFAGHREISERRRIQVPADYGNLAAVTPQRDGAVLWFSNGSVIRNVVIDSGAVLIQRGGALVVK